MKTFCMVLNEDLFVELVLASRPAEGPNNTKCDIIKHHRVKSHVEDQ